MTDADRQRWHEVMGQPFDPGHSSTKLPGSEERVATALEYIAYQLGHMNATLHEIRDKLG